MIREWMNEQHGYNTMNGGSLKRQLTASMEMEYWNLHQGILQKCRTQEHG